MPVSAANGAKALVVLLVEDEFFVRYDIATCLQEAGYVVVESGVSAGDKVVVGANFLIDAESNLRAALQAFTAPEGRSP